MLAAGTGLAPMVPILQSITDNAEDETFVTLVCCFKTFDSIYLKTFLQEQARFWNVRIFFILSQVSTGWHLSSLGTCSPLKPIPWAVLGPDPKGAPALHLAEARCCLPCLPPLPSALSVLGLGPAYYRQPLETRSTSPCQHLLLGAQHCTC